MQKVFVLGLDCASPELIFHRWREDLPNLTSLASRGLWGSLRSCIPAITVPAWSCMLSGRDPGELGIYGFRNRADHSYHKMFIALGTSVRAKRIWDYLSEAGKQCVVIGVPQTFPVKPLHGHLISDFLTPTTKNDFAYPSSLKDEVLGLAPNYAFDVAHFRTNDKDWLLRQIWEMTEARFTVADHMLVTKPWDFFMLMEIGVDRIHHGFWSTHDPQHRRYVAGNPYENAIRDYYLAIDRRLGRWMDSIGPDSLVLVVSDHGAKRMDGGICLNEWLWQEGYLVFEQDPEPGKITPFEELRVNWSRTRAWGSGGYYGRVFLNVKEREPEGVIPPQELHGFRDELAERLRHILDPAGRPMATQVFVPEQIYQAVNGAAPDLMVYFDDLLWRAVGSLGHGSVHTLENDSGPDDCNHAQDGMFILYDPRSPGGGREVVDAQLMDVATTLLEIFELGVPAEMQGTSLLRRPLAA